MNASPSGASRPRYEQLPLGLYRSVLDLATYEHLASLPDQPAESARRFIDHHALEPATAALPLAMHVARAVRWQLESIARSPVTLPESQQSLTGSAKDRAVDEARLHRQITFANDLIARVRQEVERELGGDPAEFPLDLAPIAPRELRSVAADSDSVPARPDTPIDQDWLLAAGPADPSFASQLIVELESADHLDIICSFIKVTGVRILREALESFCARPAHGRPRLRVLTTTYMGATDAKAVDMLSRLPNTEVRVSYDGSHTRLHAKAYVFHRASGFGSAYIGSANLSRAALTEGHEWVVKVAQSSSSDLWTKIGATYEGFWGSSVFESFDPDDAESARRLAAALAQESGGRPGIAPGSDDDASAATFEFKPFPFQQEVLERIAVERDTLGRDRHLVVAATGTGKTMIAAFDYRRLCQQADARRQPRPRLLCVAHQERILKQALATFRHVLKDFNFGDLLVGGEDGRGSLHLFASIQSIRSKRLLETVPPDAFDYVVIDEAHHAEAETYRRLLEQLRPATLLGLTATPERADGLDIFQHFGHRPTAEIRLPDAIERRLLSPFQYFVISDGTVDLSDVRFTRGRLDAAELSQRFIGNEARAALVMDKIREICTRPEAIRALGFCAGVKHAAFMADRFRSYGMEAVALSGETPKPEVGKAIERLRRGELQVIFTVDLFNEGVDIPEVDTVLLLRPTESLTIFLQQLGRGLRLADGKECLTVLDFVSQLAKQYKFAPRFEALLARSGASLEREIERSFPSVPAGCAVRMEPVARDVVLANIRYHLRGSMARLIADVQRLRDELGRVPTLGEFWELAGHRPRDLYQRCSWTELLSRAELGPAPADPIAVEAKDAKSSAQGLLRLAHIDDPVWMADILQLLADVDLHSGADEEHPVPVDEVMERLGSARRAEATRLRHAMLHRSVWSHGSKITEAQAVSQLLRHRELRYELRELCRFRLQRLEHPNPRLEIQGPCGLQVHSQYTRDQIFFGLGLSTLEKPRARHQTGVFFDKEHQRYLMFVTLTKTEDRFSPTTMYQDYAISESLFHWESQSRTSAGSPTGRLLVDHRDRGVQLLLFVRDVSETGGYTHPFTFLGPVDCVEAQGSCPIRMTFRLAAPMPGSLYRVARRV